MKTARIVTNLSPALLHYYDPTRFTKDNRNAISDEVPSDFDPNVDDKVFNLGYMQEGGRWHPPHLKPSKQTLYEWEFKQDTARVTPTDSDSTVEIYLTQRAVISEEEVDWMRRHPLIFDPIVAALAVFYLDEITKDDFPFKVFDYDANWRVAQFLLTLNPFLAPNLEELQNIRDYSGRDIYGYYGLATNMDTASRFDGWSPDFAREANKMYRREFSCAELWQGCGAENVPLEQRVPFALRDGKISPEEYAKRRLEQIEDVLNGRKRPIYFSSPMQQGYAGNDELMLRVLNKHPHQIVVHKLREPFNPLTNYFDRAHAERIAHLSYALKSSDPRYPQQMDDYAAVLEAAKKTPPGAPRPMLHTGDDRGFLFVIFKGANELIKKAKSGQKVETYKRNGFTFYRDINISCLLGCIGLNPVNMLKLNILLSKYVDEKINGNEENALKYEKEYWELGTFYTAYATDSFFGENDPTPAYTWKVWLANRMAGTIKPNEGVPLKTTFQGKPYNRQTYWDYTLDRRIMAGRSAALACLAGAITSTELPKVIANNEGLFETTGS